MAANRKSNSSLIGLTLLLICLPALALADLSVVPGDATVARGAPVPFMCQPRDITADKGITWTAYSNNKTQKLFTVIPGQQPDVTYVSGVDQNKYARNDTYNLIVRNAELTDGGAYGCAPLTGDFQYANLIVIGDLGITISPSSISIGSMISITCTLTYAGPNTTNTRKNLANDHDPKLTISVNGRDLNAEVYKQSTGKKIAMVNTTVTQDFVGSDILCEMTSVTSRGTSRLTSPTTVNIPSPAREISINGSSTDLADLRVNDSINCTARGYPTPTVKWQAVTSGLKNPSFTTSGSGWALLTFETARNNQQWNCTATNNASVPAQAYKLYEFNVKTIEGQSVAGGGAESLLLRGSALSFALVLVSLFSLLKNLEAMTSS